MKKRGMSIVLVLAMIFSLIMVPQGIAVNAAGYYDTEGLDCELAADVACALGIMSGYTDGSFLPYNSITRAEMAVVAIRLAGINEYPSSASEEDVQFNDMYDYDGWAGSAVAIARAMGVAKGDADGNFNPDTAATYEDAIQMVVCALGYEAQATARGGEMDDYVYVARKIGITKKISYGRGQNITRADVAKLVYAALTVDLMQQISFSSDGTLIMYNTVEGETALNTYFDTAEIKGVVYENAYAAIDGETTIKDDQVLINGEVFDTGLTNIADYLGYYVEAYVTDAADSTENRRVIAFSVKSVKNNTLTIKDEDIEDVTSSIEGYTYTYWVSTSTDSKEHTAKTSATPLVMYNGKAVANVTSALLIPETGHVVLIDNNGDDKYDIIDIWEYDLVYVLSASQTSGSVVGYFDRQTTYKFDAENEDYHVTFLNSYGGASSIGDIKQYSVLYVYQSLDKEEKKVVVSNNKITGEVTEISDEDDTYTINGTAYKISPGAKGRVELAVMDAGDFYLDADNRITGFEGSTVIRKNMGMFIAVNDGGLARGYQMKILTSGNGVQIYNIASTVKVNDEKMTAKDVYEYAFTNMLFGLNENEEGRTGIRRAHPSRAGFLYKLNSDNEICELIVVGEDSYLQTRELKTAGYLYYSKGKRVLHYSGETATDKYGNSVGKRTYCDDSTINFIMDEATVNTNDNNNFWTQYVSSYWDNYNFETYDDIWAYYYSPDGSPVDMQTTVCNFLVMVDWIDASGDSNEDTSQNTDATWHQDNTPVKFIYKITKAYDKTAGEETYRVYYFDGTSLRNALIRPKYKHVAFLDSTEGILYPNGYPVRISTDGAYIEDVAPYFGSTHTSMTDMVSPIYNASTSNHVMPWVPFDQTQRRKWNADASYEYESHFILGMVTDVDEIVGSKFFSLAYQTTANVRSTSQISIHPNERLEGNVYRMNYAHDGELESITKGSTADIIPGQLVLVRRRAYDSTPKWLALTGYSVNEIIILADSVDELDYLSNFYTYAVEKVAQLN